MSSRRRDMSYWQNIIYSYLTLLNQRSFKGRSFKGPVWNSCFFSLIPNSSKTDTAISKRPVQYSSYYLVISAKLTQEFFYFRVAKLWLSWRHNSPSEVLKPKTQNVSHSVISPFSAIGDSATNHSQQMEQGDQRRSSHMKSNLNKQRVRPPCRQASIKQLWVWRCSECIFGFLWAADSLLQALRPPLQQTTGRCVAADCLEPGPDAC